MHANILREDIFSVYIHKDFAIQVQARQCKERKRQGAQMNERAGERNKQRRRTTGWRARGDMT